MSLLKTPEQVQQAEPMIYGQQWLLVTLCGPIARAEELRREETHMPCFPEVKSSADVLLYSQDQPAKALHSVSMAADPKTGAGPRLLRTFISWGAANGLRLERTVNIEDYPWVTESLHEAGLAARERETKSGCMTTMMLGVALAAILTWEVLQALW